MDMDYILKMLIVDDEYPIREMLRRTVPWNEYNINVVGIAENGAEAMEIIRAVKPELVLSDIRMPEMDGIALAKWVYQNYTDTKVVFLSAYRDFENAKKAFKYDVVDYILKPMEEEQLFEVINKIRAEFIDKRNEAKRKERMKDIIEDQIPLIYEKYASNLDKIFNSMKSYEWENSEKYIREYFEHSRNNRKIMEEYAYVIALEVLAVLRRLQDQDKAFPQYKISGEKINRLKDMKDVFETREFVIEIFKEYFNLMLELGKPSKQVLIKQIKDYIKKHCTDVITISHVASQFFISSSYMSRLFKNVEGSTFVEYLVKCRLEKARDLLMSTDFKIYHISNCSGFGSEKHFIRVFKKHFGLPPLQYKEKSLKKNETTIKYG